jgi:hypothetical protein
MIVIISLPGKVAAQNSLAPALKLSKRNSAFSSESSRRKNGNLCDVQQQSEYPIKDVLALGVPMRISA